MAAAPTVVTRLRVGGRTGTRRTASAPSQHRQPRATLSALLAMESATTMEVGVQMVHPSCSRTTARCGQRRAAAQQATASRRCVVQRLHDGLTVLLPGTRERCAHGLDRLAVFPPRWQGMRLPAQGCEAAMQRPPPRLQRRSRGRRVYAARATIAGPYPVHQIHRVIARARESASGALQSRRGPWHRHPQRPAAEAGLLRRGSPAPSSTVACRWFSGSSWTAHVMLAVTRWRAS